MITFVGYSLIIICIILPILSQQDLAHKEALREKVRHDKLDALRRRYILLRNLKDQEIEDKYNVDFIFYNSY